MVHCTDDRSNVGQPHKFPLPLKTSEDKRSHQALSEYSYHAVVVRFTMEKNIMSIIVIKYLRTGMYMEEYHTGIESGICYGVAVRVYDRSYDVVLVVLTCSCHRLAKV